MCLHRQYQLEVHYFSTRHTVRDASYVCTYHFPWKCRTVNARIAARQLAETLQLSVAIHSFPYLIIIHSYLCDSPSSYFVHKIAPNLVRIGSCFVQSWFVRVEMEAHSPCLPYYHILAYNGSAYLFGDILRFPVGLSMNFHSGISPSSTNLCK